MSTATTEKPPETPAANVAENAIRAHFPLKDGETQLDIRPLWSNHYRVNIWTSDDPESVVADNRIARTFFVTVVNGQVTVR